MEVIILAIILAVWLHYIEKQLKRIADSLNASATADRPSSAVNSESLTHSNTKGEG